MRTLGAAVAALLLPLALTGCQGDEDPSSPGDGPSTSTSSPSGPSSAARSPYAVTLEPLDAPAPASASGADPTPELLLTNTGKKRDRYLVRLVPPDLGNVSPTQVSLAAGESMVLRVLTRPGSEGAQDLVIDVYSLARDEVLTSLELPAPTAG